MGRPRSDIDARIVRAARHRFLQDGVDGASLRNIASDAKTSIGMVYYYFPTKDDLFFAVVEDIYVGLLADMARALEPDVAVEERLRRFYRRIGAISDVELTTVRLVVREVLVSSSRLDRLLDRFKRGHIPLIVGAIGDGMRAGAIEPRLHPLVVFMVTFAVGAVPQFVRRVAGERLPFDDVPSADRLADELVKVLFHGIGTQPAPAQPAAQKRARAPARRRPRRAR
jgi:AcrR family transcriptional regulator